MANAKFSLLPPDAKPSVRGDTGIIRVSSRLETIVGHVEEGSLAAQAGIQVGDQIERHQRQETPQRPVFWIWRVARFRRLA